jgi:hypothetical protein
VHVEPAFGKDLCASCTSAFLRWVETGPLAVRGPSGRKLRTGEPLRVCTELGHGGASWSTSDYASRTGQAERSAYYTLKHLSESSQVVQLSAQRWALPAAEEMAG